MNDRVAVATPCRRLSRTGKTRQVPRRIFCNGNGAAKAADSGSNWNGWGRDLNKLALSHDPGITRR